MQNTSMLPEYIHVPGRDVIDDKSNTKVYKVYKNNVVDNNELQLKKEFNNNAINVYQQEVKIFSFDLLPTNNPIENFDYLDNFKILENDIIQCGFYNGTSNSVVTYDIYDKKQAGGKPRKGSYESMTVKELKERCSKRKIKYSGLKKAQLIAALRKK